MEQLGLVTFGEALIALKQGFRVTRAGWNGTGLFVFRQVPAEIDVAEIVPKMQSLPKTVKLELKGRHVNIDRPSDVDPILFNRIKYQDQLALVNPSNGISGYSPSGSDSLNDDWIILDDEAEQEFPVEAPKEGFTDFGNAVKMMKNGFAVRRKGWNGKGMFLYVVPAQQFDSMTCHAKDHFGNKTPYRAYFALKTAQEDVAMWSPTTADALAIDWELVVV